MARTAQDINEMIQDRHYDYSDESLRSMDDQVIIMRESMAKMIVTMEESGIDVEPIIDLIRWSY